MIVILGDWDWAGVGFNLAEAISRCGIEVRHIVGNEHPFGYQYEILANDKNKEYIQYLLNNADYLLYMSSFWNFKPCGLIPPSHIKKGVYHVGTGYRVNPKFFNEMEGYDQFFGQGMERCNPDGHLLPVPIDTDKYQYQEREWDGKIIIGHSPSNDVNKNTVEFVRAVEALPYYEMELIRGVSYEECIERKKKCHIFFDQADGYEKLRIEQRAYGLSAVEAGAFGSVVLSGSVRKTPFCHVDGHTLKRRLEMVMGKADYLEQVSKMTRKFIVDYHGYAAVAERFRKVVER